MPKRSSPSRRPSASGPKTARQRKLNPKCRGELSELAFAHKAAALGFGVAKPYGDSERFDFILISRDWPEGDKLWRVQIKSSATLFRGFYNVKTNRGTPDGAVPYLPSEVDFVVVYIVPDDVFFIFPIRETPLFVRIRPKRSHRRGLYKAYREAWHLLRPPK
ncbi:MAG TPA: group I intron-associated PD-(D/E)XK endonuclease [Terriglobales bacterium]|nr:group I intron-associated PD-(D/E)XK endonuclease [Terriglobales bacterium]